MGIVNITPDSFYAPSRHACATDAAATALRMVEQGAGMLDIGGYSSRPGAPEVSVHEETHRVTTAVQAVRAAVGPDTLISVDTFRASVARAAIETGADIVNDISGGDLDPEMTATVAALGCPYIAMHMRGTPATMQSLTDYTDIAADVVRSLAAKAAALHAAGVADVILDPGFGFAKTLEQNYRLLAALQSLTALGMPVLVGMSRKSMFARLPGITDQNILAATTSANTVAIQKGAAIIRVHDVAQARAAVLVAEALNQ